MAVSLDKTLGHGNAAASSVLTFTTTQTVAAGARIIVLVGRFCATNTTVSTITAGAVSLAQDVAGVEASSRRIYQWSAFAPSGLASGSTVTVTMSASGNDILAIGCSYLGINTTTPVGANSTGSNAATTAWASGSVAATNGSALVGGSFCDGLTGSSTPTSPAVERDDFNNAGQTETETLIDKLTVSGTDSLAGTWSGSTTSVSAAVEYKAAAAGAASLVPPGRRRASAVVRR